VKYHKGQLFYIEHSRKGSFYCQATEDFDTENDFYPLVDLFDGEAFACRNAFCRLTPLDEVPAEYRQNLLRSDTKSTLTRLKRLWNTKYI
jgi:hypothetical protein